MNLEAHLWWMCVTSLRYREPGKPDKASRHLSPKHPQVVLSGVRSFRQRLEHVGMPGVQQPDDEYRQRDWKPIRLVRCTLLSFALILYRATGVASSRNVSESHRLPACIDACLPVCLHTCMHGVQDVHALTH